MNRSSGTYCGDWPNEIVELFIFFCLLVLKVNTFGKGVNSDMIIYMIHWPCVAIDPEKYFLTFEK